MKTTAKSNRKMGISSILLFAGTVVVIVPFYWMLISSIRPLNMIFLEKTLLPTEPTLLNYLRLFRETLFTRWFLNSMITAGGRTILSLLFCSLGGFAFAKYEFKGKRLLFMSVLLSLSVPMVATLIPVFALLAKAGLVDTYWAIILPWSANAFGVFMMRQYIASIPSSLLDAGRIDGCTELGLYWRVVMPIIRPALGALAIFVFLGAWQDYMWPLIMMRSADMYTLPVGLSTLRGEYRVEYGMIMAGSFLSTLPILVVFIAMQRQFIAGLTSGGVKG